MPVGNLLVLVRDVEQTGFAEVGPQQLHAQRQTVGKPGGQGNARNACQVGGNGVDVGQVEADRVVDFLADLERRGRRGRAEDDVDRS